MSYDESHNTSHYIYGVDVVRFICAVMVTLFHLGFASWASPIFQRPYKMTEIEDFTQPGWIGVQLFFIISGFVIVNTAFSTTSFGFLKGRVLRLYPAVWICATLTFILAIKSSGMDSSVLERYARSITLFPIGLWIDSQYWTLATEICFYTIVFAMLVFGQITKMQILAAAMAISSALLLAVLFAVPPSNIALALTDNPYQAIPIYYGCDFAIGIYIWLWSRGRMTWFSWACLALAFVAGIAQIHFAGMHTNDRTIQFTGHSFSTTPAIFIWIAGVSLICLSVAFNDRISKLPPSLLKVTRVMGLMTYPLYLLHFRIGVFFLDVFSKRAVPPVVALFISVTVLCAMAYAVSAWGEPAIRRPLRKLLDKIGKKAEVSAPA